ncbi:MAG: hypothetical protein WD029_06780 [Microthrixaceae bacterium]
MMAADNPDEQLFAEYSAALAQAIDQVLVDWVVNSVITRATAASVALTSVQLEQALTAGERCRAEVSPQIAELLATDLDAQQTTPLALLRRSTSYATLVLQAAAVPQVARDEFEEHAFPEDIYGLAPASFSHVDERLSDPGLMWGAAKAHVHLLRRRQAGQR